MPNGTSPIFPINAFHAGDEKAFDQTFRTYYPALCFFAQRLLKDEDNARDIVQDCFVTLWNRRSTIDNPAAIQSYLYMMVRNRCIDKLKQEKKEKEVLSAFQSSDFSREELDEVIHAELIGKIYQCMEALPSKMKLVFKAIYLEGKSAAQIAAACQVSPKTVHKQRARAIALLKEKLRLLFFL